MFSLLIVDDEPLTREFMRLNISSIDASWMVAGEAEDGVEALAFLENHKVDLVITDIKMPVMEGLELCEKIRNKNPQQEIVILSGYDEFSFAQEAMKHKVYGYLLKPIKIKALKDTLSEISQQINAKIKNEIAYRALTNLSIDYQSHICRSYLRAIITNSNTEIKVLHPLTYKLKIDFIQAQSTIMILKLDIESVIEQKIPSSDLTIFKYILLQITAELVEESKKGYVFLDSYENIIVYITGINALEIEQKCNEIYSTVSDFLESHAGITITGSIGTPKSDVLEMYTSYMDALNILAQWTILGGNTLYGNQPIAPAILNQIDSVKKSLNSIITGLIEKNEPILHISIKNYVYLMNTLSISTILRYGLLLLDTLNNFKPDFTSEQYELCLNHIFEYAFNSSNQYTQNEAINLYKKVIQLTQSKLLEESMEQIPHKLIKDAKDFIYSHFAEPISLSQIADSLHVSPNYLSKIFHEIVGESYIKFITRIRMEYAARLLKSNSNEKISNVAEKAGYYNWKHFNFVFKEYYNMTPSEYQKS